MPVRMGKGEVGALGWKEDVSLSPPMMPSLGQMSIFLILTLLICR